MKMLMYRMNLCIMYLNIAVLCWVAQSCLTLCDPMDHSPPGSSVHGILQASILEWVAMPSSSGFSQPSDWTEVSCFAGGFFTIWATREAQEYWSGYPIPSPGDLPNPGIERGSPALQVTLYSCITRDIYILYIHITNNILYVPVSSNNIFIIVLLLLLSHFSRVRLCVTP